MSDIQRTENRISMVILGKVKYKKINNVDKGIMSRLVSNMI